MTTKKRSDSFHFATTALSAVAEASRMRLLGETSTIPGQLLSRFRPDPPLSLNGMTRMAHGQALG